MEKQILNLYIVDENRLLAAGLEQYIQNRFGDRVIVSVFYDGGTCLKEVCTTTHIVVLDYYMKVKNGLEILQSIKNKNPETEVILLSNKKDVGTAIDSYIKAWDSIINGPNEWNRIAEIINRVVTEPVRVISLLGVSKIVAIFLMTFAIIGITVFLTLFLIA